MVHCDLTSGSDNRINIAADLAERFDARVIGIAAHAELVELYFVEGQIATSVEEEDRSNLEKHLRRVEERFRAVLAGRGLAIEWRVAIDTPASFIASECRAADLVIIGQNEDNPLLDPGELVMRAGRPVLMVPQGVSALKSKRSLIAWKDAREARRAIIDALPLLRLCQKVIVVEVDEENDPATANRSVEDVAVWLARHGINAAGWSEPLDKVPRLSLTRLPPGKLWI